MLRNSIILFLLSLSSQLLGQSKAKEYVQANMVTIRGGSPDSLAIADLEAIGNAVGDARVVMLGEQTHGDGATMLAKSSLVKYLHKEKGFDVLAFEGDFFGINAGWGQVHKSNGVKGFLWHNLHHVWSASAQCSELLYSYLPASYLTQSPLEVTGFDNQVGHAYSNALLKDTIDQYLRRRGVAYTRTDRYAREFLANIPRLGKRTGKDKEDTEWMRGFSFSADTVLAQLGPSAEDDFGYLALENARAYARQLLEEDKVASNNIRDAQMARNLRWLANVKYPNRKIIVWAANAHIMKNSGTSMKDKSESSISWMGTIFTKDSAMEQQTYVLGFTSLKGSYKFVTMQKGYSAQRPSKNGFETWVGESVAFGFVDFKPFRKQNPGHGEMFMMKANGGNNRMASWTNVFDGVFYIRDMTPSEGIK